MSKPKYVPMSVNEIMDCKTKLEIEYGESTSDLDKRAIHIQIECLNTMLKGRKIIKEIESL